MINSGKLIYQLGQIYERQVNPNDFNGFLVKNSATLNELHDLDKEFSRLEFIKAKTPLGESSYRELYDLVSLAIFALAGFSVVSIKRSVFCAYSQIVFGWLEADLAKADSSYKSKSSAEMRKSVINRALKIQSELTNLVADISDDGSLPRSVCFPIIEAESAITRASVGLKLLVQLYKKRTVIERHAYRYLADEFNRPELNKSLRFVFSALINAGISLRATAKNWTSNVAENDKTYRPGSFEYLDSPQAVVANEKLLFLSSRPKGE